MNDHVKILELDDCIDIVFYIDHDEIMAVGEELEAINENAYMNGYNWEALLNSYVEKNAPELTGKYDTDPEACMYAAYFEKTAEGRNNAEAFAKLIVSLIEDKEKLFAFVREYGDEIVWD